MAAHDALQVRDCMDGFKELRDRVAAMEPTLDKLSNEFFNHDGGDGLKTIVLKHIARVDERAAVEKEFREKRDAEIKAALEKNNNRVMGWLGFIGVLFAGLTLLLGVLAFLEGNRQVKNGTLHLPQHQATGETQNAHNQQPKQLATE